MASDAPAAAIDLALDPKLSTSFEATPPEVATPSAMPVSVARS